MSLTLTSTKKNEEIAIGERIDYTLTIDPLPIDGGQYTIELRKVSDDSAVITKTVTFTTAETTGSITNTWDLLTSQTVGNYYLYAEVVGDPTTYTDKTCVITVVLFTPWMLKNVYLAGVPFKDFENNPLDDALAQMCVSTAIGQVEDDTRIFWYPQTVMAPPLSGSYDQTINRLSYKRRDMQFLGIITLPHYMVQSISLLKGFISDEEAISIPSTWIEIHTKRGNIHIIPSTATSASITGSLGTQILAGTIVHRIIPAFWQVKYVAGWDESIQPYDKDHLYALGMRATLNATPILSDALKPGVSSTSLSMDGLSETTGTTASAIYALLSARENTYKKSYQSWLKAFKLRYRGPALSVA